MATQKHDLPLSTCTPSLRAPVLLVEAELQELLASSVFVQGSPGNSLLFLQASVFLYKYTDKSCWVGGGQQHQIPVTAQAGACRMWNGQNALREGGKPFLPALLQN